MRWRRQFVGIQLAWAVAGCDVALLRGLSHDEARAITSELAQRGVVVHAVPDSASRVRLELDESSVPDAVSALTRADAAAARCTPDTEKSASDTRWVDTPGDERARQAARLEHELARSLRLLPGVADARVHLTLASGMRSVPETQTRPAASVLLVRSSDAALADAPAELVAGAVPGLQAKHVRVVETKRPAREPGPPKLARLGPIVVAADSLGTLKAWLGAGLLVQMLLAAALLRPIARKLRRSRA